MKEELPLSKKFRTHCFKCKHHNLTVTGNYDNVEQHYCKAMQGNIWELETGDSQWYIFIHESECPLYLEYVLEKS